MEPMEIENLQAENNQLKTQCALLLILLSEHRPPLTVAEIFATRLKQARREAGLTQIQLASELGMTQSGYSPYENSGCEPSLATLVKISDTLDVSLDWLLGRTDEKGK